MIFTVFRSGGTPWTPQYSTESGRIVSFNALRSVPLSSLAVDITPVQSGSGTPAYDNIRPISGWSEAKVTRCGKNLIDDSKRYVATDTTLYVGAESSAYTVALPAGTYTISVDFSGEPYGMYYRESNDNAIRTLWYSGAASLTEKTFTVDEDGVFRFWVYRGTAAGGVDPTKVIHVQIELGSTATADTYTIDLGGTRYSGTLDVTTGVLTVDKEFIQLDGDSNVTRSNSGSSQSTEVLPYWATINVPATPKSDYNYENWMFSHGIAQVAAYAGIFRVYYGSSTSIRIVIGTDTLCNTTELIKSWLQDQYDSGTPLQVVYELATPLTVQLTAQQIETLVGQNYIWADTGDTTVTYISN